jgi:hypothetical protein
MAGPCPAHLRDVPERAGDGRHEAHKADHDRGAEPVHPVLARLR